MVDILEFRSTASTPSEAEDLIEITEEADLIQADRIIDDEPYRDGSGRANSAKKLKQVEKMMLALDLDEVEVKDEPNGEEWEVNMNFKILHKTKSEHASMVLVFKKMVL